MLLLLPKMKPSLSSLLPSSSSSILPRGREIMTWGFFFIPLCPLSSSLCASCPMRGDPIMSFFSFPSPSSPTCEIWRCHYYPPSFFPRKKPFLSSFLLPSILLLVCAVVPSTSQGSPHFHRGKRNSFFFPSLSPSLSRAPTE